MSLFPHDLWVERLFFVGLARKVTGRKKMPGILREREELDLVNLERLAHILKGLSASELETLEILLDQEASDTVFESLKELNLGERIPLNEW